MNDERVFDTLGVEMQADDVWRIDLADGRVVIHAVRPPGLRQAVWPGSGE